MREVTASDLDVALANDFVLVVLGLIFWIPLQLLWYAQGSPYRRKRR